MNNLTKFLKIFKEIYCEHEEHFASIRNAVVY